MLNGQYVAGTKYTCYATILFADNTTKTLSETDFALGNNGFVDGAGASSFPLGVAVERSLSIEIQNDGSYDDKTFVGAVITFYAKYGNNTLALGKFTVLEPETYGETIIISAVDDMFKADKKYSTNLTFPVTLQTLFNDACSSCGIANGSSEFNNGAFQVDGIEEGKYTFREIFGYIAMLAGGNARIDVNGSMQIMSYDFTPGQTLSDFSSLKTDYNDITITGLKAVIGEGQDAETYSFGNDGYMLELSNPIFTADNVNDALEDIAAFVVNQSFRKFEGDHVAYPFAEFMDCVNIKDRKGNQYVTVITDVDFTFFGFTTLKNSAESALRNANYYVSDSVKTLISTQKAVQRETTAREAAVAQLQQALANASGMFSTDVTQPDESVIRYLHDKPTLEASTNILKITSEAIAISNNGGETYSYGVTFDGNFIANILSASGVNADWINTGSIVVRNNDTTVFQADVDTGNVSINGSAGNVQFTNCPFNVLFTQKYLAANYSFIQDIDRVTNIINGNISPTTSDYTKFDFNKNGVIDMLDVDMLLRFYEKSSNDGVTFMDVNRYLEISPNNTTELLRTHVKIVFSDSTEIEYEGFSAHVTGIHVAGSFGESHIIGDDWRFGNLHQSGFNNEVECDTNFFVDGNVFEEEPAVWNAPSPYNSRCSVTSGGYAVLGKKVDVSLEISIPSNLGTDTSTYFWVMYGFPTPSRGAALSISKTNDTEGAGVYSACISNEGSTYRGVLVIRYNGKALVAGDKLAITGSYWAE